MADIKIPEPTPQQSLSLSRAGVGNWQLVWDKAKRTWTLKKSKEVSGTDITYDDWQKGQKSYTPYAPSSKGALDVAEQQQAALETDPLYKPVREYGLQVVFDPNTNKTELKGFAVGADGKTTDRTVPYYMYLDKDNNIQLSEDYDKIKDVIIRDLKATNTLDTLFAELYKKKKISKQTFESKNLADSAFNASLADAVSKYSASVITNRQYGDVKEAPNFLNYLTGMGGDGAPQVEYRREFQDISKLELGAFIDQIYLETIGQKPTKEQRSSKLKELNKIVKAGQLTTTSVVGNEIQTRKSGGFDQQKEALALQEQLKTENPLEYERRQAFGFMDSLQKILSGGQ